MEYLLSLLGFGMLLISGHYLVKGSVSISQYFKVSKLVIGLTVIAFGTSAPELIVSVQAALKDHPEIAVGNVIGSNISNIALVLALTAIIFPVSIRRSSLLVDYPVMIFSGVLFFVFVYGGWLNRTEGIVFLGLLSAYVYFSLHKSHIQQKKIDIVMNKPISSFWVSMAIIIVSCFGLVAGADILIDNASIIATNLGVSERVISISLIAVGTSLPELVTSVIAAVQKESDIAVGNIFGSNIFNIFSVLGITAIIKPIEVTAMLRDFDTVWMLGITFFLLLLILPVKKWRITRLSGVLLLSVYILYIYLVFTR